MKDDKTFRYIQTLSKELFQAEERRHQRSIDQLFQHNRELTPSHGDGFTFAGQVYRPSHAPTWGKLFYSGLDVKLTSEMMEFLKDKRTIDTERKLMEQTFFHLLHPCTYHQDCRDALPDCLQDVLPDLQLLSRTRPEAYTLRGNERAMRQYEKILPRMQFYSAVRLIY